MNDYFRLALGGPGISEDDILAMVKKGDHNAKTVSYDVFKASYTSQGWMARKVIALPMAAWSICFQTTCQLVKRVFNGMQDKAFSQNEMQDKNFYLKRSLQTSFGWLATLFSDSYGQYHLQQSQFLSTYYAPSSLQKKVPEKPPVEEPIKPPTEGTQNCPNFISCEAVLQALDGCFNDKGKMDHALRVIDEYAKQPSKNDETLREIAKKFVDKGCLKQAVRVVALLSSSKDNIEYAAQLFEICLKMEQKDAIRFLSNLPLLESRREKLSRVRTLSANAKRDPSFIQT